MPKLLGLACLFQSPETYDFTIPETPNTPVVAAVDLGQQADLVLVSQLAEVPIDVLFRIALTSRQIADELGLKFTGIDWRREPQGRYVFLEANPSPMFLGFQQRTGLPLAENLASLLMGEI